MIHVVLSAFVFLLLAASLEFTTSFSNFNLPTSALCLRDTLTSHYAPLKVTPCISSLALKDLVDVWMLASQEFTPTCSNHFQALSLNLKIFLFSLAKLSVPKLWGHALYGLRMVNENKLIGMVDLSAQASSGSLSALKLTTLSSRLNQIKALQRLQVASGSGHNSMPSLQPYICNLLVSKDHRRKGYAQMLLEHCSFVAKSQGFVRLHLHVQSSDISALTLYTKLGFEVVKKVSNDVLYLQKELT